MKIDRLGQAVDKETNLETVKMSIDASAVDHLMMNLTSLYSDPVTAVLREYSSNAIDSHIRAGVNLPILITTPNSDPNRMLTIEDFGIGMSKDDIANIYSRYGLSTKGGSNDEIGGFGLGCKSALAIADRFDLVARKDGIETIAFIEKNVKGVGVVHFVSETATDQPNGVKVTIPVDQRHFNRFGKNTIIPFFVGYASNTVIVDGENIPSMFDSPWRQITTGGEVIGSIYEGRVEYGSIQSNYHALAVNIGGVTYKMDTYSMHNEALSEFASKARSYKVILNLPIGSVDLTPSREALMNTERTNATITATIKDAEQAITDAIIALIAEQDNITDAVKTYLNEKRRWAFTNEVNYRGIEITDYVSFKDAGKNIVKMFRDKRTKNKAAQISTLDSIYLANLVTTGNSEIVYFVKGIANDELAKNLVYYTQKTYGTDVFSAIVFDETVAGVSPLFDSLTVNNVSANDVVSIATEYRSVNRKAALEANKAIRGGNNTKATGTLPVWVTSDETMRVVPMEVSELQGMKKVAYIHASNSGGRLGRIFPTIGYHYNNGGVKLYDHNGVVANVREALPEYAIVFLTATRKVEKFIETIPNAVSVLGLVEKFANTKISENSNAIAHKMIASHRRGNSSQYRHMSNLAQQLKSAQVFDLIANEADKVLLNTLIGDIDRYGDDDIQTYENWGSHNPQVEAEIEAIINDITAFDAKYVLLGQLNLYTEEQAQHAVTYMNSLNS